MLVLHTFMYGFRIEMMSSCLIHSHISEVKLSRIGPEGLRLSLEVCSQAPSISGVSYQGTQRAHTLL